LYECVVFTCDCRICYVVSGRLYVTKPLIVP